MTKADRARLDLVMVLMLTGFRFSEAAAMTWDRLKLDADCPTWHLPDPKSRRAVTLPLSSQAVAILKRRRDEREDGDESPFVFPSWGQTGHIKDPRGTFKAVSDAAGLTLSAHDLRRTFLDVGNDYCGIDLLRVQMLMQHSLKKTVTTEHYMKRFNLEKLAPVIQQIGDYIERAGLVEAGANVVALKRA